MDRMDRMDRMVERTMANTTGAPQGHGAAPMRRWVGRAALAVVAAALVVGLIAPASHAGRADVERFEEPYIALFANVVSGPPGTEQAILVANGRVETGCDGGEGVRPGKFRAVTIGEPPQNGAKELIRLAEVVDMYLYDSGGLTVPEFIESICEDGMVPEPFASGRGLVRFNDRLDYVGVPEPNVTARSRATGAVRTEDGDRWLVRGKTTVTVIDGQLERDATLRIIGR